MKNVLPEGYRFRSTFLIFPAEIAGRLHWLQSVRVIQRYEGPIDDSSGDRYLSGYGHRWHDVGYWDEVFGSICPVGDLA